jgi:hypothetical protein
VKVFHRSKTKKQFSCANEAIFSGREDCRKPRYDPIASDEQRGSIMWSIIAALIFNYVIMPRWKLASGDTAKIRGAGFSRNLRRGG